MKDIQMIIGVLFFIIQIPLWMVLASTINPLQGVVSTYPLVLMFPLSGAGLILCINASTPAQVKN